MANSAYLMIYDFLWRLLLFLTGARAKFLSPMLTSPPDWIDSSSGINFGDTFRTGSSSVFKWMRTSSLSPTERMDSAFLINYYWKLDSGNDPFVLGLAIPDWVVWLSWLWTIIPAFLILLANRLELPLFEPRILRELCIFLRDDCSLLLMYPWCIWLLPPSENKLSFPLNLFLPKSIIGSLQRFALALLCFIKSAYRAFLLNLELPFTVISFYANLKLSISINLFYSFLWTSWRSLGGLWYLVLNDPSIFKSSVVFI